MPGVLVGGDGQVPVDACAFPVTLLPLGSIQLNWALPRYDLPPSTFHVCVSVALPVVLFQLSGGAALVHERSEPATPSSHTLPRTVGCDWVVNPMKLTLSVATAW